MDRIDFSTRFCDLPKSPPMNRRTFLQTTAATVTAVAASPLLRTAAAAPAAGGPQWPIGCFNRAWVKWPYDVALDGIKDAGYKLTGLLSRHPLYAAGSTSPIPG